MLNNFKYKLKKNRLARELNTTVKGFSLDLTYELNKFRFGDYWNPTKVGDSDQIAKKILQERRSVKPLRITKTSELNIFFVGTYFDHETQGFLQGLQKIGQVYSYLNAVGGYGFNPPANMGFATDAHKAWCRHLYDSIFTAHQTKPIDFLIGTFTAPSMLLDTLHSIRTLGIPIVNYGAMDDMLPQHWELRGKIRMGAFGLAPAVDLTLHTTPSLIPRYLAAGYPAIYFPFASDPVIFKPNSEKTIDVLFIGNCYGKRERLVNCLLNAGINVEAYGSGFPRGHISGDQVPQLFSRAKIILGSGLVGHSGKLMTLKLRDFDATMSGALYLTSNNPNLSSHFDIGKEVLTYKNINDCIRIVKYYLNNEEERARIALNGRARAVKEHTWDHRMNYLIQFLNQA